MTLFEGVILFNLLMLLFAVYQVGKLKSEVETLYEGMAVVMMEQERVSQKTDP